MRRISIVALVLVGALAAGAYFLSDDPKIRSFFNSGPRRENPLGYLDRLPEPRIPPAPVKRPPRRKSVTVPPEQPTETEPVEVQNRVPNSEVARVLTQILAAKKLADGISLSVSDEAVEVSGSVASREQLEAIVAVIEKGRESRRIDTSQVTIAAGE